ncbi:hypothetical protein SELMODRAFT_414541 [Selaginella moellendorffii]|uniref:Leucine-rich repeat-containing N-terminal plant-type domain-containing protein n=1 Tax=Selaginella moellendorffii TaxID=88036 RepID=D8RT38_SELML|nr:hypothetical protein SELMODRAFT_414541 [Selaginella moellendorffii]
MRGDLHGSVELMLEWKKQFEQVMKWCPEKFAVACALLNSPLSWSSRDRQRQPRNGICSCGDCWVTAGSFSSATDRSNKALNASCHKDDLKALLDLKATITLSSGRLKAWGEQCCSWPTLKCNNETGRVIALEITDPYDAGDSISNS